MHTLGLCVSSCTWLICGGRVDSGGVRCVYMCTDNLSEYSGSEHELVKKSRGYWPRTKRRQKGLRNQPRIQDKTPSVSTASAKSKKPRSESTSHSRQNAIGIDRVDKK
ncbi:hypothetical protein ACP275_05G124600 [Erythranthe tilingii]